MLRGNQNSSGPASSLPNSHASAQDAAAIQSGSSGDNGRADTAIGGPRGTATNPPAYAPLEQRQSASDNTSSERTPLLSSEHEPREGYAAPSASRLPAALRALQAFTLLMDLVWLCVLYLDFVNGFGLQPSQGSQFGLFYMTFVALMTLLVSVLIPTSKSKDRTLCVIICGLFLLNFLMIAATPQLLRQYGVLSPAITFVLVVSSVLLSIPALSADSTTVFGYLRGLVKHAAHVIVLVFASLMAINTLLQAIDTHTSLPSVYSINNTNIRLTCIPTGNGGPVALIEPGSTPSSELYAWLRNLKGFKTVCYWDRPGYGLSDNAPLPLSLGSTVDYLEQALSRDPQLAADVDNMVLVAHGTGSLYTRVFAARTSFRVAGVVLIEPLHEELFYQQQSFIHGMKEFALGAFAPGSYVNLKGLFTGLGTDERVFGGLSLKQPGVFRTLVQQQMTARGESRTEIMTSAFQPQTPLLLLSSSAECIDQTWTKYQRMHLKLTENAVAWKIVAGPHELWRTPQGLQEATKEIEQFLEYAVQK